MKKLSILFALVSTPAFAQSADDYQASLAVVNVEKGACENMAAKTLKYSAEALKDADETQDDLQDEGEK